MQFLIEGADNSLSIVYKKSIIVEKVNASLAVGDSVKFLWPESGSTKEEFRGVIIAKNENEGVLMDLKNAIMAKWKKQKIKNYAAKKTGKDIDGKGEEYVQGKKRKEPVTLMDAQIMDEISCNNYLPSQKTVETKIPEWVFDAIETTKREIAELDSTKEKLLAKIDFLKSSLPHEYIEHQDNEANESAVAAESRRRSCGMPLDLDSCIEKSSAENSSKKFENENADDFYELTVPPRDVEIINLSSEHSDSSGYVDANERVSKVKKEIDGQSDSDSSKNIVGRKNAKVSQIKSEPESSDEDLFNFEKVKKMMKPSTSKLLPQLPKGIPRKRTLISSSSDEEDINSPPQKTMPLKRAYRCAGKSNNSGGERMTEPYSGTQRQVEIEENDESVNSKAEWTLKYKATSENVKELVKGSMVCVNVLDLKTATENCKSQTNLARALMRAIFTRDALEKCTLTGQKPKGQSKETAVRPGLDKNAVDTIILFVQQFSKNAGWPMKDCVTIRRSMSQKLSEIHAESENYLTTKSSNYITTKKSD